MTEGLALLGTGVLAGAAFAGVVGAMLWLAIGARTRRPQAESARAPSRPPTMARLYLDAIPDWVMRVSRDGVILDANRPTANPLRIPSEEIVGMHLRDVYPADPLPTVLEHIERALVTNKPLWFEFLHNHQRGYGETRVIPVGGEVLVITRDTTEQKGREERLHRSKERLALAAQGANDGLWDWNLKANQVYYSYQWKQIMRLDAADAMTAPESWFDRVHPEDREAMQASLRAHLQGEVPRYENEHRVLLNDNEWLWVLSRGMAVRDANGTAVRIAGSLTDLTNRRAVAVSQEKANLLEYATSSVGIGIVLVTAEGEVGEPSAVMVDMTSGWETVSQWWLAVQPHLQLPAETRCPHCGDPHRAGTAVVEIEVPNEEAAERSLCFFELCFAGHAHEVGAHTSHVLLVQDVTSATVAEHQLVRANEELTVARDTALAASRAKSAFLANMSHELRTPLNHIMGYGEMLEEELEEREMEDLAADAGKIRTSGLRLLDLISAILDLSKIEAGISGVALASFGVRPLVERAIAAHREQLEHHANCLEQRIAPQIGDMFANEEQVTRILGSLLSNAAKFTKKGVVTVDVTGEERKGRAWVVFTVSDTGIGMTPDQIRHLWERFYMADESSTRGVGGAGLGLTLAHRFTDMMGGSIDVHSVPGEGSTFQVALPRRVPVAVTARNLA